MQIADLVHSYRELGHLIANLDPLGHNMSHHPLLELSEFNVDDSDMDRVVTADNAAPVVFTVLVVKSRRESPLAPRQGSK